MNYGSDSQIVEIIGRHWLTAELLRAGLEVATPARDRGVDLLVYSGEELAPKQFVARPIQLKAASHESFGIDRKYERLPGLLHVFLWYVAEPTRTKAYALYYPEMVWVAEVMGWTRTGSWRTGGRHKRPGYSTRRPTQDLRDLLGAYEMNGGGWRARIQRRVTRNDKAGVA